MLKAEFEMVKPQYDLSRLNPELLRFLMYTHNYTSCSDAILLSMLQLGMTSFADIFMEEDDIYNFFLEYEAPDGKRCEVQRAHCYKFSLAVLYAQF